MAQNTDNQRPDTSQLRNVKVKALRPHGNSHGDKYWKEKDATYTHPRPDGDIKAGIVEVVDESEATPTPTPAPAKPVKIK